MMLKTIFEKYKIDNKIFAIGLDNNASNNTIAISQLIVLCNPYFDNKFFSSKICMSYFKIMCSK